MKLLNHNQALQTELKIIEEEIVLQLWLMMKLIINLMI